ncbi:LTA synthase family protein [Microlunatus ginsengisoli]|uniref:Sulfatase N-terminal domain-containing protein n=1 Tax=Microlunatus ginsengisoli TaxID=363863 RepID=A0ABP6ZNW2_9ACTN
MPPRPARFRHAMAGFSRSDRIRLVTVVVSLLTYLLTLKLLRIASRTDATGVLGLLDLVRSDIAVAAAIGAGAVAVVGLARPGRGRQIAFALVGLVVAAIAVVETIAHLFYVETGSALDLAVVNAAWSTRSEIGDLVDSQLSTAYIAWLALVGVWFLLGPPLVAVLIGRPWRTGRDEPPRSQPAAARQRLGLVAAMLGVVLLGLAGLPTANGTSFGRDPLLNAALSPLEARRYAHAADASAADPPIDTRLVRTGNGKPRNVALIFLESVRDISTTLADPDLSTTPYLARLAKTSLVAENAYTVVPHTSKALTAGNCGVVPPLDMNVTEAKEHGINGRCLPELLTEQGYASAFFQSATEHYDDRRELVRNFGYDSFYPVDVLDKTGYVEANYFGWEDDILLGPSKRWLTAHRSEPFVTGYLTVTSHHDYKVPTTIDSEHLSDDPELNRYLNTVRYGDRFVARLIQQYKDLGLYDNTVFVIMADHGEGFGEHGLRQHDNTIYTEGVKIPLIVHDPRHPKARRVEQPVQLTSVLPTVVDALGFRVSGGSYPGESLLQLAGSDPPPAPPVRLACYVDNRCLASIEGSQKYVFHFGQQPDEFFDLATDPGERHNIISAQNPDTIAALRADLLAWRAEVRAQTAHRRR